jgi:hypothetical protein
MEQSLTIMLAEVALLAVIGLVAVLLRQSRQKNTGHRELEYLLDDFQSYQSLRAKKISHWLMSHHEMEPAVAHALTLQLQAAEKRFMAAYVKQQLDGSVAEFYDKLCQLLDVYLKAEVSTLPTSDTPLEEVVLTVPKKVAADKPKTPGWMTRLKSRFGRSKAVEVADVAAAVVAAAPVVDAVAEAASTSTAEGVEEGSDSAEKPAQMLDGPSEEPNKWGDVFD